MMLVVRRVVGESMLPGLPPGQVIVSLRLRRLLWCGRPVQIWPRRWRPGLIRPGRVVIVRHGGVEKIKRVYKVRRDGAVFVLGDNPAGSTDSRQFGWLDAEAVLAVVVWPRRGLAPDRSW